MLECGNESLYTGITDNLIRRITQHRSGCGARYVRMHRYRSVAYVEEHPDRSSAMKREIFLKGLPRKEKMLLATEGAGNTMRILRRWGLEREFGKVH